MRPPTAYDHLLSDSFDESIPQFTEFTGPGMPPWHRDLGFNPLPSKYQKVIDRLRAQAWGDGWRSLMRCYGGNHERDVKWAYNEFHFETYGCLGLIKVGIKLPGTPNSYSDGFYGDLTQIWTSSYEGGWRDGVWWSQLATLVTKQEEATIQLKAEQAREEKAAEEARKAAENNSYLKYLKGIKT